MKTETKYALLSDFVYSRNGDGTAQNVAFNIPDLISGATLVRNSGSLSSGLYAEAWSIDGKIVIVFRGTDFNAPDNKDITTDVALALGSPQNAQLQDAIAFVEAVKVDQGNNSSNFVFAGHSLGGGLAALMAAKYGKEAYVYAPAPFKATSDSGGFIPDGLDADSRAILLAGKPTPPLVGGLPDESDPDYQSALASYYAAKSVRDAIVNGNYAGIHSYGLDDELLQKYHADSTLVWIAGQFGISHFDSSPDVSFFDRR
ncbi:MAG: hypothetical protein NTAFB05_08400 [Nitrobacter sp.]|uniref:lipase family protein n=1 Tax=Nitrobacter sp. TaxID=29420 RepID=UPI00387DFFA2